MTIDADFWRRKRVLLTGHTGFKGSWLSLWLQSYGAELHGLSLAPPTTPALFTEARVGGDMDSTIDDIRDYDAVRRVFERVKPEIVLHMAAQPLVRLSYSEPLATYATNVMGTAHVLEAARHVESVKAIVVVTTDKCYENKEWIWGYREDEPMGGYDPYSNSKGCAELVTSAYRRSFMTADGIALASARAGNVIGGGDWAADRLVPDILRAFERQDLVVIRNPHSIRPWQHVLEPLSGYLELAQRLYEANGTAFAEGWNFGPRDEDARPVRWIVERMIAVWGDGASWRLDGRDHPHEAGHLKLDIAKAGARLDWSPRWSLSVALDKIVTWHRAWMAGSDMRTICLEQISDYLLTANSRGL
jgi:CDP-glucose 4,6-dehydratase